MMSIFCIQKYIPDSEEQNCNYVFSQNTFFWLFDDLSIPMWVNWVRLPHEHRFIEKERLSTQSMSLDLDEAAPHERQARTNVLNRAATCLLLQRASGPS